MLVAISTLLCLNCQGLDGFDARADKFRRELRHNRIAITFQTGGPELRRGVNIRKARIAAWHHSFG